LINNMKYKYLLINTNYKGNDEGSIRKIELLKEKYGIKHKYEILEEKENRYILKNEDGIGVSPNKRLLPIGESILMFPNNEQLEFDFEQYI
jgi:hypothetical protein